MREKIQFWRFRFAFWVVGMFTVKDATVVPAAVLADLKAQVVEARDYIAIHSGRLNDGTTRAVRRKLRARMDNALETLAATHSLECLAKSDVR